MLNERLAQVRHENLGMKTYQGCTYFLGRTKPPRRSRTNRRSAPSAFATTRFLASAPMALKRVTATLWMRKVSSQNMKTLPASKVSGTGKYLHMTLTG